MKIKSSSFFDFNLYEFLYDLMLLLYVVLINQVFAKENFLISNLNETQLIIFIFLIDIAVPYYLGKIYKNYEQKINNPLILKTIFVIFSIITIWLYIVIPINLWNYQFFRNEFSLAIIFLVVLYAFWLVI